MSIAESPKFVHVEIIDDDRSTHAVTLMTDEGDDYFVIMDGEGVPHLYRRQKRRELLNRCQTKRLGPPPKVCQVPVTVPPAEW
jgi:hypothetical protein